MADIIFRDRQDAGRQLADKLSQFKNRPNVVILGLPRGGVVVAYEIAEKLNLPLDIVVPRKIGAPGNPEFAIGAITEDGEPVLNQETVALYSIPSDYIKKEVEKERQEARRRLELYRGQRPPLILKNKMAVLVDDGIATGATMRAAILSVKTKGANKVVVAAPTVAADTLKKIKEEADEVVYIEAPEFFGAVGAFYEQFAQTEDQEVIDLLKKSRCV